MDLNKKIKIKLKYIIISFLVVLLSLGITINEIKSNQLDLIEQTDITKTINDSLNTQLNISNDSLSKISLQITLKENKYKEIEQSLYDSISVINKHKIRYIYKKRIKNEYYENGNIKSEEI